MSQLPPETTYRENLSAGVDGELAREELRFLLRRLNHDAELQQAWARYHVIRDVLRQQPVLAGDGIAERVQRAIGSPHAGVVAGPLAGKRMHHWLRWSGGGAIAAGVAVAALMLAQPAGDGSSRSVAPAAASQRAVADLAVAPQPSTPAAVPPWLSNSSASQYSQQAAATLGESFGDATLPYARSVSPYRLQKLHALREQPGYLLTVEPRSLSLRESRRAASAH
jgi:sigma-E factor negative regulatory protein RseA